MRPLLTTSSAWLADLESLNLTRVEASHLPAQFAQQICLVIIYLLLTNSQWRAMIDRKGMRC